MEERLQLGRYIVFICPRCGTPRYGREGQKTAKCFSCGFIIPLIPLKTRILLRTESLRIAKETVNKYKMKRGGNPKIVRFPLKYE